MTISYIPVSLTHICAFIELKCTAFQIFHQNLKFYNRSDAVEYEILLFQSLTPHILVSKTQNQMFCLKHIISSSSSKKQYHDLKAAYQIFQQILLFYQKGIKCYILTSRYLCHTYPCLCFKNMRLSLMYVHLYIIVKPCSPLPISQSNCMCLSYTW